MPTYTTTYAFAEFMLGACVFLTLICAVGLYLLSAVRSGLARRQKAAQTIGVHILKQGEDYIGCFSLEADIYKEYKDYPCESNQSQQYQRH